MKSNDLDLKKLKVLVADRGLMLHWAFKLSEFFGEVFYWTDWHASFPVSNNLLIGDGFDEITRVRDFWDIVPEIDLFVFPFVYDGDLQLHLEHDLGKRVWGSRKAEEVELYREKTKELLKQLGLPVQPYQVVRGIPALREALKKESDRYVKISALRGEMESWHHINYKLSEPVISEIEFNLGAKKYIQPFLIEDPIDSVVELGYDGFTVDGRYPEMGSFGYEIKDCGFIGTVMSYDKLPKAVRTVNDKLAPIFKGYGYRGWFSSEIRVTEDGTPYFIDPTCRSPSPPGESQAELFENWGEIIWRGAGGEIVNPVAQARYGVQAVIRSNFAAGQWQPIYFPEKIARWVKLQNACRIKDTIYIVPQETEQIELGYVVGTGNTLLDAIKQVKKHAEQIEGFKVEVNLGSISEAVDVIAEGEEHGIKFSDEKLPTKAEIDAA